MVREGMRGDDQQQNHIFSYLSPEERVRKDHPLRAIWVMVDEVLQQLSRRFDAMYAKVGRPSIAPEKPRRCSLPESDILRPHRRPGTGHANAGAKLRPPLQRAAIAENQSDVRPSACGSPMSRTAFEVEVVEFPGPTACRP